ncbi:Uncharacterised protein [Candidatus Venteria ishoeyi]|uniref:Uncharacterized protein n=1 Tax=Candidatus Venteria ishoeyi TaxID=1899563 RepID=A0A1H6F6S3_9GAMM|nr:Uncharacterised protein [Candidatus Venteria ishoeyi]
MLAAKAIETFSIQRLYIRSQFQACWPLRLLKRYQLKKNIDSQENKKIKLHYRSNILNQSNY